MFTVVVTDKSGQSQTLEFDKTEVTIGRIPDNDIVLAKSNISKKHARIIDDAGALVVVDAKSTNGTYLNGKRIDGPHALREGDRVFVGDFTLEVHGIARQGAPAGPAGAEVLADDAWGAGDGPHEQLEDDWGKEEPPVLGGDAIDAELLELGLTAQAQPRRRAPPARAAESPARAAEPPARAAEPPARVGSPPPRLRGEPAGGEEEPFDVLGEASRREEAPPADAGDLADVVLDDAEGQGPLSALLDDESVTEIIVHGATRIYVRRAGELERSARSFSSDGALLDALTRLLATAGRGLAAGSPLLAARLADGAQLEAVLPPVAVDGPYVTIRKPGRRGLQVDDLVASGTLTAEMAAFLETCVFARRGVLVSGGAGAGKTAMLGVLSSFIPARERILTVEEVAELDLEQEHVVRLVARPPEADGRGGASVRELVRQAVRLRPDRIVAGPLSGAEAFDLLQAMAAEIGGSLVAVHAGGPHEALARLETLVRLSGVDLPGLAVRHLVASAIGVVLHLSRFPNGARRLTRAAEVTGVAGEVVALRDIFVFRPDGVDAQGVLAGRFVATGVVPGFYESMKALGIDVDTAMFRER